MFDAVLSNSECTTMECLRELTNEQLKSVATATTDSDMVPHIYISIYELHCDNLTF